LEKKVLSISVAFSYFVIFRSLSKACKLYENRESHNFADRETSLITRLHVGEGSILNELELAKETILALFKCIEFLRCGLDCERYMHVG